MQIDEERQEFMPGDHMAQNDINIGLNVTSNGSIQQETNEAQKLAQALKSAEKSAAGTSKALNSAKAASAPSARNKAPTLEENIDYGVTRASVGTGAASRDFAKQSQGLGGLVRLYATFAANIFALTAAFTALSNAADTSNLVKGLDQLGAASGRALGTLSKQLADASDGAISLRDSMESVAKASSAGLSNKQILALGESAKQASQALGLSMPDALSRLTRGISKLEPELLDELGIFIKIDDATRKYGLSIGKSAASLSDFERRQAFANAVLEQAKEKFGDIKLDVNPYSKLLASFQNVAFAGLELVNKVLGPLVKLLSESPTALSVLLTAIGAKLFATAIPAIGEWRNGLKAAAEQASKTADAISRSFGDEFQGRLEASFRIPGLEKNLAAAQKKVAEIAKSIPTRLNIPDSLAKAAPSAASATANEKGFNNINRLLEKRKNSLTEIEAGQKKASSNRVAQIKQEVAWLENEQKVILRTIELNKAKQIAEKRAFELAEASDRALTAASKEQGRFDPERIALEQAKKARLDYDKISAVSNAAENTRVLGVRLAWKALNNEIADKGITGLDKFTTLAKGGLASVGTRILGIVGSLANFGAVAAAAFAGFEIVSAIFSKNDKQVAIFKSSIEDTQKASEVLLDTLEKINKKEGLSSISITSLTASSTALNGVTESLEGLVSALDKANKSASGFDRFIDGFLSVIGKDLRSSFVKTLVPSIVDAFNSLPEGEAKAAYEERLKSILGVTNVTIDNIKESLAKLSPEKLVQVGEAATQAQKSVTDSFKKSADQANNFKETLAASVKAYQELGISLTASDPISKLGQSLVSSGLALDKALQNTTTGIATLAEFINDTSKLSLLPENTRNLLIAYSDSIEETSANVRGYSNAIKEAQKELEKLRKEQEQVQETTDALGNSTGASINKVDNRAEISRLEKLVSDYSQSIKDAQGAQEAIVKDFLSAGNEVFKNGVTLLTRQIASAREQAALTVFKAQTQQATGFAKIAIDASIQKQEIQIQLKLINVQEQLVISQNKTNLLLTELNLETKKTRLEEARAGRGAGPELEAQLAQINIELSNIKKGKDILERAQQGGKIDIGAIDKGAAAQLGPLVAQLATSQAQRATLGGQLGAVNVTERQQQEAQAFKVAQEKAKAEEAIKAITLERLTLINGINNSENSVLLAMKQQAELANIQKDNELARAEIVRAIVLAADTLSKVTGDKLIEASRKELNASVEQLKNFDAQVKAKTDLKTVIQEIERINATAATAAKDLQFNQEIASIRKEAALAGLESEKEYLDYLIKAKVLSEEEAINRTAALEKQLLLQKESASISAVRDAATSSIQALGASTATQLAGAADDSQRQAIAEKAAEAAFRINTLEEERVSIIKKQTAAKLELLDATSKEEAQYAKISSISEALAKAFGAVGESAAKFGSGIGNVLKVFATTNNKRVALEKDTQKKLDALDKTRIENTYEYLDIKDKATKESTKLELDAAAEQAGAAKTLFAEKTFAYKAFAAVEKAIHVAKLAMIVTEVAANLASVGPTVAAEGAKSAAKGTGAILSALNAPFPVNFVAGAMMAAIVASLLGGSAGKVNIPNGVSAKDVQETQGTGMSWVNGKKVENGGGVFGDASAKSESISKSLETIKNTSVEGITFYNKMVDILEKINVGINGAAKSLYSIPGIRTGSQFGTQETTKSSGIQGLFGKTVSKNIADSGIKIAGIFTDLLNNAKGIITGYETVSTTTKRSGFLGIGGSTKTSISTQYKELDATVSAQISNVFQHATDLFVDAGEKLGMTAESVFNKLGSIRIDQIASLKDLKGSELETELNAILSNILDNASNTLFASLDKFKKFGEGMLETVVRVIDSNEKIKASFKSISKNLTDSSFEVTDSLANLSGGLENFLDSVSSYKNAFLSEAEQLIPIQVAVTAELARLGFSSVKTADDFKYLINGLDTTTTVGRETFTSLLKISDSFARLSAAADKTDNLRIDLLEAEGKTSEATALRRAKELKEMSATDAEIQRRIWLLEDEKEGLVDVYSYQSKILKLLNKQEEALALTRKEELDKTPQRLKLSLLYSYALEDEANAKERAVNAINNVVSSLKNSINTLKDLRSSILGGDKSILTPEQKYAQAKNEALALSAQIAKPANTPEEIKNRDVALSKLPNATNVWLEASRNLYASSEIYTQDFNTILSIIDSTSGILETQLTDSEKQLQILTEYGNILNSIDESSKTTTELLEQYLIAVQVSSAVSTLQNTSSSELLLNSSAAQLDAMLQSGNLLAALQGDIKNTNAILTISNDKQIAVNSEFLSKTNTAVEETNKLLNSSLILSAAIGASSIDAANKMAELGVTDTNRQIEVLKSSADILSIIKDNTGGMSLLLGEFLTAETARLNAAVVNVTNPITSGSNAVPDVPKPNVSEQLVAELIKVNKEAMEKQIVAQQEAAAAIIRANAAAEAAAAAAVIAAQKEAADRAAWQSKNRPTVDSWSEYYSTQGGY